MGELLAVSMIMLTATVGHRKRQPLILDSPLFHVLSMSWLFCHESHGERIAGCFRSPRTVIICCVKALLLQDPFGTDPNDLDMVLVHVCVATAY